jgi:carboxyl-terminal processing protease
MTQPGQRFPSFKGHSPLVIAALALASYVFLAPREMKLPARQNAALKYGSSRSGKITEADSSILMDSIVSLVQNYYVDFGRVSGEKLIAGTMRSLAYAVPALKFYDHPARYSLESSDDSITFPKNVDTSYEQVIGQLRSLVAFCDRIRIGTIVGPADNAMLGDERDSSSIVLNAMLSSLDAHSSLLSSEAYQELRQGTEGSFGGLGVLVGIRDNVLTVLKPLPKSPALRMGVKEDDKIIAIDGQTTFGVGLDRLVTHMRGAPGTSAELVTLSKGDWGPKTIKLQREVIAIDSVEASEIHSKNLHVLKLSVENFASRTSKEIREHIRKFRAKYPISGLVLDLRGNPGGLLDQAINVSDIFLDSGVVVTTRGRREEVERANQSMDETDYPIVVLMNEDSASASEIVAGALQDNRRALVVGQPSFGKGSVQTVFELPEQRALKLTIARYFTPANKSIQNVGIMPDVWIQPVIKSSENANLFGSYRYRNEQFLPNHLNSGPSVTGTSIGPLLKGYFLATDTSIESKADSDDPSMKVALGIFAKLFDTYGNHLPQGARRSAHWAALSKSSINQILEPLSREAMSWLNAKHGVVWRAQAQSADKDPLLSLEIKEPDGGLIAVVGEFFEVPWRVRNGGDSVLENVSVFVQSPVSGIETKEYLIGRIGPSEVREGRLKIQIPFSAPIGGRYVNAGMAINAQALPRGQDEFVINIHDRAPSPITADLTFKDGAISQYPNILEMDEKGAIQLSLSNNGALELKNIKVVITNLGGRQLILPVSESAIPSLSSGEKRVVNIPVQARSRFESSSVVLGVTIRHDASAEPVFAVSKLRTSISIAENTQDNISH